VGETVGTLLREFYGLHSLGARTGNQHEFSHVIETSWLAVTIDRLASCRDTGVVPRAIPGDVTEAFSTGCGGMKRA